jgi:DNA polymerase III alpha subunit (gram-positive type)
MLQLILGAYRYKNGIRLSGVIYMHRISDFRMGGISRRNFSMFRQLCGESSLKNVVLVTNMWSEVSAEVGEARETELRQRDIFFKPVLDRHARLLRHENTLESAQSIIRYLIGNHPMALRIQRELVDQNLDISQTAAGAELNRELMEQVRKHQQELLDLQVEVKSAIKARDEETRKELEEETRKLQVEMARIQGDSQKLASDYNQQYVRMERQMQIIVETAKKDAERAAVEHQRQMKELNQQLQHFANGSASQKDIIQRQIGDFQRRYEVSRSHSAGGVGLFGQIGRIIDTVLKFI